MERAQRMRLASSALYRVGAAGRSWPNLVAEELLRLFAVARFESQALPRLVANPDNGLVRPRSSLR